MVEHNVLTCKFVLLNNHAQMTPVDAANKKGSRRIAFMDEGWRGVWRAAGRSNTMTSAPVLVVEDDYGIREALQWALEDEGYTVVTAPHGAAALEMIPSVQPRVILVDLRMPIMDGYQFVAAYRNWPGQHVPVIVLSATNDLPDVGSLAADAFIEKPFEIDHVLSTVAQFAGV